MKRMIISPAQLKMINEATAFCGEFDGTENDLNAQTAQTQNNSSLGAGSSDITSGQYFNKNGVSDTPIVYTAGVTKPDDLMKAKTVVVPQNESRFSKRQVELGRMLEMRRTGKVFSKKQLNEMFMETQENANELRSIFQNGGGRNLAFKVAEIIDDVFPEESYGSELLDAVLGGADPAEFIIQNIFSDFADKEQEREVLDRIRELTTKRGF